ncbi:MAG: diiron oxygenase [Planctomycetes bacterium]|nr:diiron oxygenase [Planctomycetota bacterium]
MDLARMLDRCRRDQWEVGEIDWESPPRPLSVADEVAFVQHFSDMAGIERLAAALFAEQRDRASCPVLREVFATFVADELRHADVAERLARRFDVHGYRAYRMNPALVRFTPHFVDTVRHLSAEVANVYITTGELILDVALLRSLNDAVADPVCAQAMERINRDESRHIAVDFHMIDYYSSPAYQADEARRPPRPLRRRLRAWWAFANTFRHAAPFFREVFFRTMDRVDPTGRRLVEAFKRIQLVSAKPQVARRPFVRFLSFMQGTFEHPLLGPLFGPLVVRILGIEARVLVTLTTEAERRRAREQSFDDMAAEALALKHGV